MNPKNAFFKLWGAPILLAIATLAGLLSALIGDGLWDGVSWILLGLLVVVISYYWTRGR